jgi:hypothetical protein
MIKPSNFICFALTVLLVCLLVALIVGVTDLNNLFVYSFVMTFGFLLIPGSISTLVLYFIKTVFKQINKPVSIPLQMILMFCILFVTALLLHIPDYLKHQNELGYNWYKSFLEYFNNNLQISFLLSIAFSIAIPWITKILETKCE